MTWVFENANYYIVRQQVSNIEHSRPLNMLILICSAKTFSLPAQYNFIYSPLKLPPPSSLPSLHIPAQTPYFRTKTSKLIPCDRHLPFLSSCFSSQPDGTNFRSAHATRSFMLPCFYQSIDLKSFHTHQALCQVLNVQSLYIMPRKKLQLLLLFYRQGN